MTFTWNSDYMFHYTLKAEFVTLVSLKVSSGWPGHDFTHEKKGQEQRFTFKAERESDILLLICPNDKGW